MDLVDTHSHFDADEFDPDRDDAYARAVAAGVRRQVVPAVSAGGWGKLRDVCRRYPGLHPAYGLHPGFLHLHARGDIALLRDWLGRERPVAVGECGLDFYIDDPDRDEQQWYFERQLELAAESDLPVVIHARRAVEEVILTLRRFRGLRGVVHSFPGSREQAAQLEDLGFLLGIGGPVTYPRARKLRRVVADVPQSQLLLETDSPDQPNCGGRGQRNEPAHMRSVLESVAALRSATTAAMASVTTANAEALFGLPMRVVTATDGATPVCPRHADPEQSGRAG